MDTLRQDLRFAARTLRRSPAFAISAIIAVALGIGANTAIFSIADALVLRPAPFQNANRLVVFWRENPARGARYNEVAPADFAAVRARARSFGALAAYDFLGAVLSGTDEAEQLSGLILDDALLPLLGVAPAQGRAFTAADTRPGAPPVVLISHGLWQRRFADGDILGRAITLDGVPVTVIGIMPRDFHFAIAADVYRPLVLSPADWQSTDRWLRTVAMLRPGVAISDARRDLDDIAARLETADPASHAGWRFSVHSLNEGLFQGPVKGVVFVLLGAVACVLLIACADVANLLLARASDRAHEVAIRTTLGASRRRLVRQLLTESLLLSLAGGLTGLLLAAWCLDLVRVMLPANILEFNPRLGSLGVDARALVFTAALTFATGLLFGGAPALRASRPDLTEALKDRERGRGAGPGPARLRGALVGLQLALALVLLAAGTLLMRSFLHQQAANPGFRSDGIITAWVSPRAAVYDSPGRILGFHEQVLERVAALPQIARAGLATAYPLSGEDFRPPFDIVGQPTASGAERNSAATRSVSAGYHDVIGLPIRDGRAFAVTDRDGAPAVAIVSESFARRFFPGRTAIGRRLTIDGDSTRVIVGVVADLEDWRTAAASTATLYLPLPQYPARTVAIVARVAGEPASAAGAIRRAVHAVDDRQPVYGFRTMRQVLDDALFAQRLSAALMTVFAVVALLLAAVGSYGVMAYNVSQRTSEFGIRMALGARPAHLTRDVVARALRPVLLGLASGIAGALALTRLLRRFVWHADAIAATSLAAAALVLAATAVAAVLIPAWRAARLDPLRSLRRE